jgi:mRNA interferase MazF
MEIRKWGVYLANLEPARGTEPGKIRPVVVVQTDLLNGVHPSTVICPVTTNVQPRTTFLRVHLSAGEGGLKEKSDVLVDQVRAIDNRRFLKRVGILPRRGRTLLARNLQVLLT